MHHRTCFGGIVILVLWLSMTAPSHGSTTGQLPLSYRISAGSFPWTGRLHAVVFRTARIHTSTVLTKWEAGAELDWRDTASRRLYLGGDHLVPLHWHTIDADAQAVLRTPEPSGNGTRRLAWLRGDRTDATLRPRDTRLASGAGARVRVVAAPAWLPMQPGHAQFRLRHASRPVTVWIGTRDGIVHGFDAVTGKELAGFLPRAALAGSAALTVPGGAMPVAPCPRPDSIDADPSGVWRTLLLCGIPSTDRQPAAVFALDVSSPESEAPIRLLWEIPASETLPLTGQGPIRALMWIEHGARRWAALTIVTAAPEASSPAGIALLPLDRPIVNGLPSGTVPRLYLPSTGCGADTTGTRLLAASVLANASGHARAAYVVDDTGRLWRFGLDHLGATQQAESARCLHRQRGSATAEAPIVMHPSSGPLVIYAGGGELSAIPDGRGPRGTPSRIDASVSGDGVIFRTGQPQLDTGANGWTLALPHPGESITTLDDVGPAHLSFTTLTPDGRTRSYLIEAASGESVMQTAPDGTLVRAVTGVPFDDRFGTPIAVASPTSNGGPVVPGSSTFDTFELGIWQVDGNTAHLAQNTHYRRRRGRLGWRELIRTEP
ncbi:type IV pilus assembly protein PilY1 [Cupriavidus metallidurans]|jgi:type IV pilus assembly protein PilY1|uniref:Type IV pilus assembly protein, tip-associated adhesin (PilY1-like) n=1 Tax=Cupriavidus metallidurans (strain ATCC 43123 / DSM 2839 / NBRC 102507 / CH34) TaxID=266264 RepID=Q1LJW8_CUPMC|nr:hypothetical protein [Cupriavidus metallidurans]ABF09558.1 putative Type IV pilus assembly protein, tip-associated adhesin (PilY1-like) [Cupriavidus metallidurans CH34]AVA36723.1 pilus assembly protein PilY [Cupriavidus metallidurans]KWW37285.1 Type IV pilus biogenesis factor PilY1 [Cupriavidus metallidurans]MDE4919116.1 pilus assembly protein PilY [Cupriavidus metallidurans]QGS30959.1 pilus assembly protein PilY [Cupriavidus metallidurans]